MQSMCMQCMQKYKHTEFIVPYGEKSPKRWDVCPKPWDKRFQC